MKAILFQGSWGRKSRGRLTAIGCGIVLALCSAALAGGPPSTGLKLRLVSELGVTTATQTIGVVTQWDDQSGGGRHATQANSALRPQLVIRTFGRRLHHPVIQSVSNSLAFVLTNATSYSGFSVFYVANRGPSQNANETVLSSAQASPGIRWALGMGSDPNQGLGWGGTAANVNFGSPGASANMFYVMSYVLKKSTGWTIRKGTSTVSSPADTSFPTDDFNGAIGSEMSGLPVYPFSGDIAEVLVYSRDVITDGDWQQVYDYLWSQYFAPPLAGTMIVIH